MISSWRTGWPGGFKVVVPTCLVCQGWLQSWAQLELLTRAPTSGLSIMAASGQSDFLHGSSGHSRGKGSFVTQTCMLQNITSITLNCSKEPRFKMRKHRLHLSRGVSKNLKLCIKVTSLFKPQVNFPYKPQRGINGTVYRSFSDKELE